MLMIWPGIAIAITVSVLNWTFDNSEMDQKRRRHI